MPYVRQCRTYRRGGLAMTRIGGTLDYAALIGRDRYRPLDRDAARAAAVELRQRGLTVADIASALGISVGAVADLLGQEVPRG